MMKARELTRVNARGDDRNLAEHGSNPHYWYSIADGMRLLTCIRKEYLGYIGAPKEGEQFAACTENHARILITDPYYAPNFNTFLNDDINRIAATNNFANLTSWQRMPTTIIIPLISGAHWRTIKIDINYKKKSVKILFDDPYENGAFPSDLKSTITEAVKVNIEKLIAKETGNNNFELLVENLIEKNIDQQGHGSNMWDCGPIVFSNIEDYVKHCLNNQESFNYSVPNYMTHNHQQIITDIRIRDIERYSEIIESTLDEQRLEQIKEQLEAAKKDQVKELKNLRIEEDIESNVAGFSSLYIEMFFMVMNNRKLFEGKDYIEGYSIEEQRYAYQYVLEEMVRYGKNNFNNTKDKEAIEQKYRESIAKTLIGEIIKQIDTIADVLSSKKSPNGLLDENIKIIKEALFKISWRSSEVPTQVRFGDKSVLKQNIDEKTWLTLDYLSNVLTKIEKLEVSPSTKNEYFKNFFTTIEPDLISLKRAFQCQGKAEIENIQNFVSFFYDNYLLNKILSTLDIISHNFDNVYELLRTLEVTGECFKNFSPNTLEQFPSGSEQTFRGLRNVIEKKRDRLDLLIKYNKDVFQSIFKEIIKLKNYIPDILSQLNIYKLEAGDFANLVKKFKKPLIDKQSFDINLEEIKKLITILKAKTNLPRKQIEELIGNIVTPADKDKVAKILYKLDNDVNIQDLNQYFNTVPLQDNSSEARKKLTSAIELAQKPSEELDIDEFKTEMIKKVNGQSTNYNFQAKLSNLVKKGFIKDSDSRIKDLITALSIKQETVVTISKSLEKLKDKKENLQVLESLENPESLDALFKSFHLLTNIKESEILNVKKFYLRKLADNELGRTKIISFIDQLIPSLQETDDRKEQDDISPKSTDKKTNFDKMSSLIKKVEYKIQMLDQALIKLSSVNIEERQKNLLSLTAQYLLEDIGEAVGGLITYEEFKDCGYLSISKRQFFILNVARKAMAHHPMQIHEQMLEFYVEQLVLDTHYRLRDLRDQKLMILGEELTDFFIPERDITLEELEQKKPQIKDIIRGAGFTEDFVGFSKKFGCDIGIQGDFVFVVFPISEKANSTFELELELSYYLNSNIKVYTYGILEQHFYRKITPQHQSKIRDIEKFDDFLVTKKFEQLYDAGKWAKAKIPGKGEIHKGKNSVSKAEFARATEVEYVFDQYYKNNEREKVKHFRLERIEKVKEIKDIIRDKATKYAQNITEFLVQPIKTLGVDKFNQLFDILIIDKRILQEAWSYFINNECSIRTQFPELKTKYDFLNYASKPTEFFTKFPALKNLQELIINKRMQLNTLTYEETIIYTNLGIITSQLKGVEIIEYIRDNFQKADPIFLAIFENLKDKYCDNTEEISLYKSLLKQKDLLFLDFSSEVEYIYLQKQKEKSKQLKAYNNEMINKIISGDLSVLESLINSQNTLEEHTYTLPIIANGIMGFYSELDPDLKNIHEQVSSGSTGREPLIPNLFIEGFVPSKLMLYSPPVRVPRIDGTLRFNAKLTTLKDLLMLHTTTPTSYLEKDAKKIADYYEFRQVYDKLSGALSRISKYIDKSKNLSELISKTNYIPIKELQQKKLKAIVEATKEEFGEYDTLLEQIYSLAYTKERIIKVLQNPFKLQEILDAVQAYPKEKREQVLQDIFTDAYTKIKAEIKQEILKNCVNLSKFSFSCITDCGSFDSYLENLEGSLAGDKLIDEIPDLDIHWGIWEFDITGLIPPLCNDNPCLIARSDKDGYKVELSG